MVDTSIEEKAKLAFAKYDKDNSGTITRVEFVKAIEELYKS